MELILELIPQTQYWYYYQILKVDHTTKEGVSIAAQNVMYLKATTTAVYFD